MTTYAVAQMSEHQGMRGSGGEMPAQHEMMGTHPPAMMGS